jgi:hypothetical protein
MAKPGGETFRCGHPLPKAARPDARILLSRYICPDCARAWRVNARRRCRTMREALKHKGHDEAAIACDQGYLVVTKDEANRLAAAGKEFAYICDHRGTLVTVPVNDRPEGRE